MGALARCAPVTYPTYTLVPINQLREQILRNLFRDVAQASPFSPGCSWRSRGFIVIRAGAYRRRKTDKKGEVPATRITNPGYLNYIKNLPEKQFMEYRMSYNLYFILGHTYKLTRNLCVEKGAANNMMITAVDLCIDDEESNVHYDPTINAHVVDAMNVENCTVQLKWEPWKSTQIFPGLGLGEMSFKPDRINLTVNLPTRNQGNLKDEIALFQLPLLHAGALVLHRVQGLTIEDNETLYIAGHRHPSAQSQINLPWYYVAASRLRLRKSLHLSHPIHEDPEYYKLNPYFLLEFTRLQQIGAMTNLRIEQAKRVPNKDLITQLNTEIADLTAAFKEASSCELQDTTTKQANKRSSPVKPTRTRQPVSANKRQKKGRDGQNNDDQNNGRGNNNNDEKDRIDGNNNADQNNGRGHNNNDEKQTDAVAPIIKPLGLKNFGVTCYLNGAIQLLSCAVLVILNSK